MINKRINSNIDATTHRYLLDTLTLANALGAMIFTYKGEDIADTILHFAREYRVGYIVIGRPSPPVFLEELVGQKNARRAADSVSKGIDHRGCRSANMRKGCDMTKNKTFFGFEISVFDYLRTCRVLFQSCRETVHRNRKYSENIITALLQLPDQSLA